MMSAERGWKKTASHSKILSHANCVFCSVIALHESRLGRVPLTIRAMAPLSRISKKVTLGKLRSLGP